MYQLTQYETIIRLSDMACIPPDPRNIDYAKYLKWVEKGGTPEPADKPPEPTEEQLYEAEIRAKEKEILRSMAIVELAAEAK